MKMFQQKTSDDTNFRPEQKDGNNINVNEMRFQSAERIQFTQSNVRQQNHANAVTKLRVQISMKHSEYEDLQNLVNLTQ